MLPYERPALAKPDVVFFGGGGGTPAIIRGFTDMYPRMHVAVILAMADRGGSTGRLLEHTDGLPVGDMTMAFIAVSDSVAVRSLLTTTPRFTEQTKPEDIAVLNDRFIAALPHQYRQEAHRVLKIGVEIACQLFEQSSRAGRSLLEGHSYRNFTFMSLMQQYHDVLAASRIYGRWVSARAQIIPVTNQPHYLVLNYRCGGRTTELWGEDIIDDEVIPDFDSANVRLRLGPKLGAPQATSAAKAAVQHARCVVIGPGSPVTSLGPSFLFDDLIRILKQDAKNGRKKMFVVSNLCQERTTPNLTVTRLVDYLKRHGIKPHKVLVNTADLPGGKERLALDPTELHSEKDLFICAPLVDAGRVAIDPKDAVAAKGNRSSVHHDARAVAAIIGQQL